MKCYLCGATGTHKFSCARAGYKAPRAYATSDDQGNLTITSMTVFGSDNDTSSSSSDSSSSSCD